MAAVAESVMKHDIGNDDDGLQRKIHGVERSWLHASLTSWGEWIWENRDYQGFRSADPVAAWRDGGGRGQAGHIVLCLDMPHRIYSMHARVLLLPEDERDAIGAEYIPGAKADGTLWTRAEKAEKLGLTERGYRDRLSRARLRILGINPV